MTDDLITLDDLRPLADNPRTHPPENLALIARALRTVGPARSGVIDETNTVLAGNGTREALAQAGITRVRVIEAAPDEWVVVRKAGLTPEQKRLLAYYDNRAAELAGWAAEAIIADVARGLDLEAAGVFDQADIEATLKAAQKAARAEYDFLMPTAEEGKQEPAPHTTASAPVSPRGQMATAERYPLAIVLTAAEMAIWRRYKETLGIADDKRAFLRLLEAITHTAEV